MSTQSKKQPGISHSVIGRNLKTVTIANDLISSTIIVDQGADIHTLVYRPLGVDVLWKTPREPREPGVGHPPTGDSLTGWIDYFRGGWNLIFPNFGSAVTHRGAPLEFHGEAARIPWKLGTVKNSPDGSSIEVEVALQRSPFRIHRLISVASGQPMLTIRETITNEYGEEMECMWAHHPAFGAPLVSADCVIETGAKEIQSDDSYHVPGNDLPTGQTWPWPQVQNKSGDRIDLSRMPAQGAGYSRVLCLKNFSEAKFTLTNRKLGLGVEMTWDKNIFPFANFWQETGGERGYPFYGECYVVAVEPSSSYPAQGLLAVMQKTQTHMTFKPRESKTTTIRARLFAT